MRTRFSSSSSFHNERKTTNKYCHVCLNYVEERSHHCYICQQCIPIQDHHCFFLGTCIGRHNQKYFLLMLFHLLCAHFIGYAFVCNFLWNEMGGYHFVTIFKILFFNIGYVLGFVETKWQAFIGVHHYLVYFDIVFISRLFYQMINRSLNGQTHIMATNGHTPLTKQDSKSTAVVEVNTLSEDNQLNPADHDGVTSDYSIHVDSKNTTYTNEFIESKYIYDMNHCEVDQSTKRVEIIPRKYQYIFRTKRQVQRTGVMLVGWGGNNGSTFTGATIANRDNITWMRKEGEQFPNYYGSLTQSTTIRIGSNNEGKEVHIPFNTILPMLHPNDIIIGGWDINDANLYESMKRACVFDYSLQEKLKRKMTEFKPLPSIYYPDFIAANQEDRANNLIPKGTKQQDLEHIRNDIRNFKKAHNLEKVIVLWTANTERYTDVRKGLNLTGDEILQSIAANDDEISPSNIFACAAILEDCPYINGSPQNTLVPGLIELAEKHQVFIGGDDFKSGQTKLKSVLADFLVSAGLKLQSIVSYNHLGNNDGKNLSAPQQFRSKEISKSNVVDDMVGANHLLYNKKRNEHPDHVVVIKYVPFVKDSKRAMDEYISSIFMNGLSTIAIHNTCEDSLLASPLIIDLVILTELMTRITYKTNDKEDYQSFEPVLAILSYLLKAPLVPPGTPVINALFKQHRCITNILSACAGIAMDTDMLLEHKTNLPKPMKIQI
ncbi:unnamed protein product [Adineta steineri]|uniref:Palmitoyltransferase n=2 Tax=Adineta steineri TaxID=433720 RepID=A0A818KRK9_9BILA|nr:unnamed protein product [Adineta steineri]CAF3566425.1 unnamed protein product [Adineta steineri]